MNFSAATPWIMAGLLVLGFCTGWGTKGVFCDNEMLEFKESLNQQQADQRALTAKVEAAQVQNTAESTARVDTQEQQRAVEVRYVDREIIKYRDRPGAGKCRLPIDWVRLYNQSGSLSDRVPQTVDARPQADGRAPSVPAVARDGTQ